MNDRERFLETMRFGSPDRIPYWECAFWGETFDRWIAERLPESVVRPSETGRDARETALCEHFGFDRSFGTFFRGTVPVNIGLRPGFERTVLSEEDGVTTEQNTDGVVFRWSKTGHSTKQFLKFPVENRSDFAEVKKRLDASTGGRFPADWKEVALGRQKQGAPICLQVGGYYGFARNLMGLDNLSIAFHDQRALVEEIFEHRTAYLIPIIEKVLADVRPDFAEFWEDMAYKTGSLVSPTVYRELALKHYRQITDLLRSHGVDVILLDSDGNIDDLIPVWLDGGINCVWPLEIAADTDAVALRKKYGTSLGLIGGIDKRVLARDETAIEEEVMSKVPFLVESGGFIPTCDHAVPPEVPLANYEFYLGLIRKIAASG